MVSEMKTRMKSPRAACISKNVLCMMLFFYIAGFLLGKTFLNDAPSAQLFAGTGHTTENASGWVELFSSSFLSKSAFLLFVAAAGFSAVGIAVMPLLFAIKGLGFGVAAAALWKTAGKTGLVQIWLMDWLPEAILLGMMFCLADAAWPLSQKLARICFSAKGTLVPFELRQRLLGRYLILQVCEIGICLLDAHLQIFFSGIFG